jgi:O-antigen ligase
MTDRLPSLTARLACLSLALLAFTIPLENVMIPGVGLLGTVVGMVAVGICALAILDRGTVRPLAAGHVLMMAFVLWASASYLWSFDPEGTLVQVALYFRLLLMVWLVWQFCARAEQQARLLQAYLLGAAVAGVDTIHQFIRRNEAAYQRYAGAGMDPNDLGVVMALSVPIAYCFFLETAGRMRWLYVAQLVLAGITILLGASRGAMLAVVVGLSIVPATAAALTRRELLIVSIAALLMVASALAVVPESAGRRLSTIPDELMGGGELSGRSSIWAAGAELFRDHPFVGVGAGGYLHSVRSSVVVPNVAHNTFLSIAAELGLIGLAIFGALLGFLALESATLPWLPRRLWLVCLAVWMVGVSSLTWEMRKPTWWLFGLMIAQQAALRRPSIRRAPLPAPSLARAFQH